MKKQTFVNTAVEEALAMVEFGDSKILSASKGEITCLAGDEEDTKGTELDVDIFGDLSEDSINNNTNIGHITLSVPVLNVNYLYGSRPILPKLIGLDRKTIEKVVYFGAYLIVEDVDNYKAGDIITENEYSEKLKDFALSGAGAIEEYMLRQGLSCENIVLHYIPILPYGFRFMLKDVADSGVTKVYKPCNLSFATERVITQKTRLDKLFDISAPEIVIRNEMRLLQESVDTYINNGAKNIALNFWGEPLISMQDAYKVYFTNNYKHFGNYDISLFNNDNFSKTLKIVDEIRTYELKKGYEDGDVIPENEAEELLAFDYKISKTNEDNIKQIIEDRYPMYIGFKDKFIDNALRSLEKGVEQYKYFTYNQNQKHDDYWNKNTIYGGIIPTMDCVARNLAFT